MASGSHTWKGTWALLPIAPMNSSTPPTMATSARALSPAAAASRRSVKRNEPTAVPTTITPSTKPTSATLLVMNALMAAALLAWSSHQWPISR